jgi:hypothetical protein
LLVAARDRAEEPSDEAILRKYGFEPDPVIEAYKRDVDRSLLRQNLRRTPEERWRILAQATLLAEELRRAGKKARGA